VTRVTVSRDQLVLRGAAGPDRVRVCDLLHAAVQICAHMIDPMKIFWLIPVMTLAAALSGCASLSENECQTADWESIGYRDGSRGYDAGRIVHHAEACAEYNIKADRELYEEGRVRGLELFCTSANGLRIGRQGSAYTGVCPLSLEQEFVRGYELGRELHALDSHMQQLQSEVQRVQAELRREEPPLTDKERDALLYRLRDLEREYGRSESDLRMMESRAREVSVRDSHDY
jgi:Protein of unknown function (DUF2799)